MKTETRELSEARENVSRCEEELQEAESHLDSLLRKYGLDSANQETYTELLPTAGLLKGWRLLATNNYKGGLKDVVLQDRDGNELARWRSAPMLGELLDVCGAIQ